MRVLAALGIGLALLCGCVTTSEVSTPDGTYQEKRIPLLSSIPLLGLLFRHRELLPSGSDTAATTATTVASAPAPPSREQARPAVTTGTLYIVQRGDSLSRIARSYDTTVAELRALNNLKSDVPRIGQKLLVRAKAPAPWVEQPRPIGGALEGKEVAPTVPASDLKGIRLVSVRDSSGQAMDLYERSYALLVGVSKYTAGWPSLPSIPDELALVDAALQANGFSTDKVVDPTSVQLKKAFEDFIAAYGYKKNNRLLFFYSGHGWSRKGGEHGYLVPTDAPDPRTDEEEFLRRSLNMTRVMAWCKEMDAKHALFLFDSCFSGAIFKTKALPATPPHITALTAKPVRQFISAGDAGEEVPAKSVFVTCFLRGLSGEADLSRDGYVTGTELGMYLHDKVIYYKTGQTPQYGKMRDPELDEGDFVFEVRSSVGATR